MPRLPTTRVALLEIIIEQNISDESGKALVLLRKEFARRVSNSSNFMTIFRYCRDHGLLEMLEDGRGIYLIELSVKGAGYLESQRYVLSKKKSSTPPEPVASAEAKTTPDQTTPADSAQQDETAVDTNQKQDDTRQLEQLVGTLQVLIDKSRDFDKLSDRAESLDQYSLSLCDKIDELNQKLAQETARNLRLAEENNNIRKKLADITKNLQGGLEVNDLPKLWRPLAKKANEQYWKITQTKSNHYKWTPPYGDSYISSGSPSDHRSLDNTKAALKKKGLKLD